MKNLLIVFLAFTLLSCGKGQETKSVDDKIFLTERNLSGPVYIEGESTWTIEERMAHYGVPGVSMAVIYDGKIEWAKTYGIMNKEDKTPVTGETLFQAGSISKPVAAYGALTLVQQGRIGLEEDVNTYLKSWKLPDNEFTKEKKVTLKNLLNHSGGLTVHGFLGYSPDLPVPTLVEVLNGTSPANSGAIFVDKKPEEGFRYSGGGYTVMQQMMMDVEGKSFPELMEEVVLQPLGMASSTYEQPLYGGKLKLAATGYLPDGTMTKGKRHTYPEMAAAGLWTTAEDLAKFAVNIQQTLKGKSEAVLNKDMTTLMVTPFVEDYTGLGVFITKKKNEVYFGHGGWDEGFSSELVAHTDNGYGVVILTNSNHPAFISELINSVALTYGWDEYVSMYKRMELDIEQITQFSGRYRIDGNWLLDVYEKDTQLYVKGLMGDPEELVKITDSTFINKNNDQPIQFKTNETGKPILLVLNPDNGAIVSTFTQLGREEKIPIELLLDGEFDLGLKEYQQLKELDPKDPTIVESNLNDLGYSYLANGKLEMSRDIFKINTLLYPNSSNVYDSYAEASMEIGDTDLAIENYKKSLSLDPKNTNAEKMIAELQQKRGN
ncbi:serine hydrolase domain-containing protein [Lunatibacter salilacus]|uniref:serine hydrolase domain-containing protein n=1 Tax=Lunatibacter salilacus TaxID=2483804 RepID=UPI00131DC717|nr:serine hydrolase domain-containing protein [Lunatibacter salilacus]